MKRLDQPLERYDVIVIGAGAAGMMCAAIAGKRGRAVLVVEHGEAPGEKIRISGGGPCNFTNRYTTPAQFVSNNPHYPDIRRQSASRTRIQLCCSALLVCVPPLLQHHSLWGRFNDDSSLDVFSCLVVVCASDCIRRTHSAANESGAPRYGQRGA